MRVFVAGAWGAVGRPLCTLLVEDGHAVTGTTRSAERAAEMRAAGVEAAVVDVLDAAALEAAVIAARPEVVIHQLTDLPRSADREALAAGIQRTGRLRSEGTRNLVAAARAAGARRLVAQSICFAYAEGPEPHRESDPLATGPNAQPSAAVDAILELESLVTGTRDLDGLVLRYGRFYGPGTWTNAAEGDAPVHVEAAAHAARLAITRGEPGIYNVAEDDGHVSIERAQQLLGWDPRFRLVAADAGRGGMR